MFINNFDPVAIHFFSMEIRWYSLAYIFGILIGWIMARKIFIINDKLKDEFDDFISYIILGIIIGGRLGYVLIYNPQYYLNNFSEILKIWEGGMSFHGGLMGIILASILFAKKNNQKPLVYLDIISLVAPVGIFFGRLANFINSELYGTETDLPWGVKFLQVDNLYRHPSQLYEAFFEGLVLFLIMKSTISKQSYKVGTCSYLFLIYYGIFRIISEFFREPDEQLGYFFEYLSMGTILSIFMILAGLSILNFLKKNEKS